MGGHGWPEVRLDPKLFKEVHTTKHGLMRIFQVLNVSGESKAWVADPKNRICDAPGSWYCVGQYPPALKGLIAKRKNFSQLEDFNRKQAGLKLLSPFESFWVGRPGGEAARSVVEIHTATAGHEE